MLPKAILKARLGATGKSKTGSSYEEHDLWRNVTTQHHTCLAWALCETALGLCKVELPVWEAPWAWDQDNCFDGRNPLVPSPAGPATWGHAGASGHLTVCHQQIVQISLLCCSGAAGTSLSLTEVGRAGGSSCSQIANLNTELVLTSLTHRWSYPQKSKVENFSYQITLLDIWIEDERSVCSYSFAKKQTRTKGSNWG